MENLTKEIKKKLYFTFLILGATLVISYCLNSLGVFTKYDNQIFDVYARAYRQDKLPNDKVKVVLIDDYSLNLYSDVLGRWPWPRAIYQDVINFINLGDPKAILFDILFSEDDILNQVDDVFATAMKDAGNVHLGGLFSNEIYKKYSKKIPEDINQQFKLNVQDAINYLDIHSFDNHYLPIPILLAQSKSLPIVTFNSDNDGIMRRNSLLFKYNQSYFPSLATSALLEVSQSKDLNYDMNTSHITIGDYEVPINQKGEVILNHYPVGFEPYSISGLIASWQYVLEGDLDKIVVNPSEFEDAIVIIGASAMGLHDLKTSPTETLIPGSELHATIISNVLNGEVLKNSDPVVVTVVALVIMILTAIIIIFYSNPARYFFPLIILGLYSLYGVHMFNEKMILLSIFPVIFPVMLTYFFSIIFVNLEVQLEKSRIKNTFSKYLSPNVMKEVLTNYDNLKPEVGQFIESSILFSDIRNFTSISEHASVERVVQFLNEYFEGMISEVYHCDGTMDKMIGDAIMAFWNAPIQTENHAIKAVESGFRMQEKLVELNKKWQNDGFPEINIGVGINTGEVIIGNIGSQKRLDYTAIGDNVNVASRLEGLTKHYGSKVLISEFTYENIKSVYKCRILDKVTVKGKHKPIKIYEPFKQSNDAFIEEWETCYKAYLNQDWKKADALIENFIDSYKDDKCAMIYKQRINKLSKVPFNPDWDGTEIILTK